MDDITPTFVCRGCGSHWYCLDEFACPTCGTPCKQFPSATGGVEGAVGNTDHGMREKAAYLAKVTEMSVAQILHLVTMAKTD